MFNDERGVGSLSASFSHVFIVRFKIEIENLEKVYLWHLNLEKVYLWHLNLEQVYLW